MRSYYLVLMCLTTLLQAQVNTPQVGSVRFADGAVRPVFGLSASFVVGRPAMQSADASSFSDFGGIVSRNGHIQLLRADGSLASDIYTGDREAVVNIDAEFYTAAAWLPASHSILYWNGTSFEKKVPIDSFSGRVTCIRRDGNSARLLVLEDKTVSEMTVSLQSGNLESAQLMPGVGSAALRQKSFVIFADEAGIEVEGTDGFRRTLVFHAADVSMERMASDWVHLRSESTDQDWALHVTPKLLDISRLPSAVMMDGAK